jgi:phosphoglycolate phosphatase-like HAD superfamily hydrolase
MVGDRRSDVRAGERAGCRTILFPSSETRVDPETVDADHVVETFVEAAEIIRAQVG